MIRAVVVLRASELGLLDEGEEQVELRLHKLRQRSKALALEQRLPVCLAVGLGCPPPRRRRLRGRRRATPLNAVRAEHLRGAAAQVAAVDGHLTVKVLFGEKHVPAVALAHAAVEQLGQAVLLAANRQHHLVRFARSGRPIRCRPVQNVPVRDWRRRRSVALKRRVVLGAHLLMQHQEDGFLGPHDAGGVGRVIGHVLHAVGLAHALERLVDRDQNLGPHQPAHCDHRELLAVHISALDRIAPAVVVHVKLVKYFAFSMEYALLEFVGMKTQILG
mmetsp:Transcript_50307/g.109003  ORF Transcript_50307/g.109003 Transcript_50307/m.109003 type:complete len:275 (+) Transcript_50307:3609-4433(+)